MVEKNIEIKIGKRTESYTELLIKVNDVISKMIQDNTRCPKNKLSNYFSNNVFSYKISNLEEIETNEIIKTAENIANNMNTKEFIMTILTNNGKDMMPAKMHELMQNKYHLKDNIEWFVSLMFVNLGGLITQPEFCYRSIEEDMDADDCNIIVIKKNK